MGGGIAPTITTPPVLAWTVEIGNTPTLTDPVYTGDTGTITWTLYRDGVADGTIANVSKATAEAYAAAWSGTNTGVNDIGKNGGKPQLTFVATVTNGSGSDSAGSNAASFDPSAYPVAILISDEDTVLADSDTTVDQWDACDGALAYTAAAASSSVRPDYDATGGVGGRPLVCFVAVNGDRLTGTLTRGSAWSNAEAGFVGNPVNIASGRRPISYYFSGASRFSLIGISDVTPTADRLNLFYNVTTAAGTTWSGSVNGVEGHYSGDLEVSGASNMRFGGTVQSTTSGPSVSIGDAGTLALGAYAGSPTAWADVEYAAAYCGGKLTDAQRLNLRAYLTGRTGVSC